MTLKTVYQQRGSSFFPAKDVDMPKPLPQLPAGNYTVRYNPMMGFYLEMAEIFELPHKLYGDAGQFAARIVNTFLSRQGNTGVMLEGEKGSGKSMTAKAVSALMLSQGHPTLIVNQAFGGDDFNSFLAEINQPCVVLFDEFEKVYNADEQQKLLTVLDGVFTSRKLFLLTCNRTNQIDINMTNRPGRLHYWRSYAGLSPAEIREFAEDALNDKKLVDQVVNTAAVFQGQMNFDMLRALIQETNLYPDMKVMDHLRVLNVQPNYVVARNYKFTLLVGKTPIMKEAYTPTGDKFNPAKLNRPGTRESAGLSIYVDKGALICALEGRSQELSGPPQNGNPRQKGKKVEIELNMNNVLKSGALAEVNPQDFEEIKEEGPVLAGQASSNLPKGLENLLKSQIQGKSSIVQRELRGAQQEMLRDTKDGEYTQETTSRVQRVAQLRTDLAAATDSDGDVLLKFTPADLVKVEMEEGRYTLKHPTIPVTLVLTREEELNRRDSYYWFGE